jgi:hypothetical protein
VPIAGALWPSPAHVGPKRSGRAAQGPRLGKPPPRPLSLTWDRPLRAGPRPRSSRPAPVGPDRFGARRTPWCLPGEAASALIGPLSDRRFDGGGVPS